MDISQDFIKAQEEKLNKKRNKLVLERKRLHKEDPYVEESENPEGRTVDSFEDDAAEDSGHTTTVANIESLDKSIAQIDKALEKIKNGTYGLDEETNKPISIDRLKAYPEATTLA